LSDAKHFSREAWSFVFPFPSSLSGPPVGKRIRPVPFFFVPVVRPRFVLLPSRSLPTLIFFFIRFFPEGGRSFWTVPFFPAVMLVGPLFALNFFPWENHPNPPFDLNFSSSLSLPEHCCRHPLFLAPVRGWLFVFPFSRRALATTPPPDPLRRLLLRRIPSFSKESCLKTDSGFP